MDFVIRPAEIVDAPAIAELNEIVQGLHFRERPDWFKAPDAEAFRPTVEEWLRLPMTEVFVADAAMSVIGYSVAVKRDRPDTPLRYGIATVELDQVVVAHAARHIGVGRALCQAVIDWATEQGAARVELGTWAFNDTAYQVFSDLGFEPTIRRMSLAFEISTLLRAKRHRNLALHTASRRRGKMTSVGGGSLLRLGLPNARAPTGLRSAVDRYLWDSRTVSDEGLVAVAELVDVVPKTFVAEQAGEYNGVVLETGRLRIHAVRRDGDEPLCGSALRRTLPTGHDWLYDFPPHIERCAACQDVRLI